MKIFSIKDINVGMHIHDDTFCFFYLW